MPARPFGETLIRPSSDSGAVPTKNTGWASRNLASRSSISGITLLMSRVSQRFIWQDPLSRETLKVRVRDRAV